MTVIFLICINFGCSHSKDIDIIVSEEYDRCKCGKNKICIINFANLMDFEWDTMCYYSGCYSLEDINDDLGFKLNYFVDIGDRVIFLNKKAIVYQKEWSLNIDRQNVIVFKTNLNKFKISRDSAIFLVEKKGSLYYLENITSLQ